MKRVDGLWLKHLAPSLTLSLSYCSLYIFVEFFFSLDSFCLSTKLICAQCAHFLFRALITILV